MRRSVIVGVAAAVAVVTATAGVAGTSGPAARRLPKVCRDAVGGAERTRIATAKLFIENNATDEDIGVHGAFDDDGWSELCVFDPDGRPILVVDPRRRLNRLTMAGIFFESREPPVNEFSMAELAAAFPEGRYRVRGRSFDGTVLIGRALFTHDAPAAPTITAPVLGAEPEDPGVPIPPTGLVVEWDAVTETVDGGAVDITGYEVIVTKEEDDDRHGSSRPAYDVHVGPGVTSLSVPDEFLEPGTVYELEVLALEHSGNQTISVGFFATS